MNRAFRFASSLLMLWSVSACTWLATDNSSRQRTHGCCRSKYAADGLVARSTDALGQEYKRLKQKHCSACEDNHSDLQMIMRVLGERLNGKTRAEIEQMMGSPDTVKRGALVYYWRYEHDYLIFRRATDGVATSSWFHALE